MKGEETSVQRKQGFTVIELMVGLGIFIVLLSFAFMAFRKGRINNELRLAAREIVQDLEYTKRVARKNASTAKLDLLAIPAGAEAGYSIVDESNTIHKAVRFTPPITANTSVTEKAITFYANDRCASDCTITVINPSTTKVFTITVTRNTGLVKLQEN